MQSPSNESSDNVVADGHRAVNHRSDVYHIFILAHDFDCHSDLQMPNIGNLAKDNRRQIFSQYMTLENEIFVIVAKQLISFGNISI